MKPDVWSTLVPGYRDALATYAESGAEQHLEVAYELGRQALKGGCGVLDMIRVHQEALACPGDAGVVAVQFAKAAETFLLETLSPFEAAHRGFRDACERLRHLNAALNAQNGLLAATNMRLQEEIIGREAAQETLQESESKFRSVVESARDGIVTIDSASRIVAMNSGAEAMFGYARCELLFKTFTRLLAPERRALARYQLRRLVSGTSGKLLRRTLETCALHRDGTEFPVELSLASWSTREGAFFTGIVRDIRDRKQAEDALRESREHYMRLFEEARGMEQNLRRLSTQLLTAQEEERKHISRELHDEIGQTLTAANVSVALLRKHAQADPEFAQKVEHAQRLLEQCMDMVHRFARELRPSMLDHLGPFAALQNYVKSYRERTGIAVEMENAAGLDGLNVQQGTVLYRVAQECLTNVLKHARASRVKIRFRQEPNVICMDITDNGRGAARVDAATPAGQRLGLLGMQERVRLVQGQFAIDSTPRRGTTVRVQIPISPTPQDGIGSPTVPQPQHRYPLPHLP